MVFGARRIPAPKGRITWRIHMDFLKKLMSHAETKRGAAHLLVGLAIGIVSTLLTKGE